MALTLLFKIDHNEEVMREDRRLFACVLPSKRGGYVPSMILVSAEQCVPYYSIRPGGLSKKKAVSAARAYARKRRECEYILEENLPYPLRKKTGDIK